MAFATDLLNSDWSKTGHMTFICIQIMQMRHLIGSIATDLLFHIRKSGSSLLLLLLNNTAAAAATAYANEGSLSAFALPSSI